MSPAFDRLSPRHRDCLRLAHRRLTTKEIARELGLAPGTVSTYCSEAIAILDAADRRDAAELLHRHEADPFGEGAPAKGLADPVPGPPAGPPTGRPAHFLGPLAPANRDADNDASITTRLAWIVILAVGLAIGFGSLAAAVRAFSDIVRIGHVGSAP